MFDYHRQHGIGRFLAELTKQVFSDLSASKYQMAEQRITKYGKKQSEWDQMASWIVNNELYSENVVWLIQVLCIIISVFDLWHLSSSYHKLYLLCFDSRFKMHPVAMKLEGSP
ncbi:putative AMP deaminase [Rosa chinensis]|uniref:Putative AMP deaminase n=1 Tax=Rosa chinensis TaxID=74649 RepID=A0A2P6SHI8_ROSCH|nr:probable AMP deaminase [Rosa chinensis]PRQ58140.1 putative AMP deaminase [Rosa chinensis]